ncbi:hypothetical protein EW026_g2197 [Hermanssonia centrifuga]|uniref:Uncharacterized protein n=1 Tax=Hermanssonia centrifuga TaxID=98765 RepID=A0A4S4KP04_9APHY|nr:hypothetical protein EW026_g2197 [Hermanssonia centrifuga]
MVNQKRIDDTVNGNDQEAHLFNGMGWITAGIKLGVIETVVGFAPAVFGEAITRRVLRFLGRAMLIIGVIKGVDTVEDFSMFNTRERPIPRRSALLALIANPRNSSFRQIGGYDFESSMAPPAAVARSRPISEVPPSPPLLIRPPSAYKPSTPVLTVDTRNASPAKTSRVIVRYGHGRAPTLDLRRISDLSIPSPLTLYDPKSVPGSLFDTDEEKSSYFPGSMSTPNLLDASSTALANSYSPVFPIPTPERGRRRPSTRRTYSEGVRDFRRNARRSSSVLPRPSFGSYSGASENMDVLHALAMQFPGLPPRMPASSSVQPSALDTPMQDDTDIWSPGLSRSTSGRSLSSSSGLVRRSSSVKRKPVPGYLNFENDRLSRLALSRPGSVASKTTTLVQEIPVPPLPSSLPTVTNSITFTTRSSMSYTRPRRYTESEVVTNKRSSKLEFPWVEGAGDIAAEGQAELDAAWMKIGFSRIKSVGSVPRRSTPTPSHSTFSRDSIAAEWHNSAV